MLPKLSQPIFSLELPSTKQKIRFRQFTVREEKILLMAQSSDDARDTVEAFKQLINNCCLDPIDVDSMSAIDVEWFFLQLRTKSVGNIVKMTVKDDDGKPLEVNLNLDEAKVHTSGKSNKILLSEEQGIGVILKYPDYKLTRKLGKMDNVESVFSIFREIIDSIFDAETVYPAKDSTEKELDEFVMSLNTAQLTLIKDFLSDMPYVYVELKYKKTSGEEVVEIIRGSENFFA